MDKKRKNDYYSVAILICLLLIASCNPFISFIDDKYINIIISLSLRIVFIFIMFYYIKKNKLETPKLNKLNKKDLLFIPLFLATISNFFVVLYDKSHLLDDIDILYLVLSIILSIFIAIIEEVVFRGVLTCEISKDTTKLKTIVYSSLIFGGVHILNISSLASIPYVLVQVVYTSLMGLLFSFVYLESDNIIIPIIFHLSFNILNGDIINYCFNLSGDFSYYLINIIIGIVVALYGLILYRLFNHNRGGEKNVTKDLDI